jgi:hypothetical protein
MTDFRQRFVFVFPDRAARRRFPHRIGNRDAGEVPAALAIGSSGNSSSTGRNGFGINFPGSGRHTTASNTSRLGALFGVNAL